MIYGYSKRVVGDHGLLQLREVSLHFDATGLERLSKFCLEMAEATRSGRLVPGQHRHIDQFVPEWPKEECDIVVIVTEPTGDASGPSQE